MERADASPSCRKPFMESVVVELTGKAAYEAKKAAKLTAKAQLQAAEDARLVDLFPAVETLPAQGMPIIMPVGGPDYEEAEEDRQLQAAGVARVSQLIHHSAKAKLIASLVRRIFPTAPHDPAYWLAFCSVRRGGKVVRSMKPDAALEAGIPAGSAGIVVPPLPILVPGEIVNVRLCVHHRSGTVEDIMGVDYPGIMVPDELRDSDSADQWAYEGLLDFGE